MSDVVWGTNRFERCRALVSFLSTDVLLLEGAPLRVTFRSPEVSEVPRVVVEDNLVREGAPRCAVVSTANTVVVLFDGGIVLSAAEHEGRIALHTDFRSLGLLIHSDALHLEVGGMTFQQSVMRDADTAIVLG
jgi:hypothetical protein